MSKSFERFDAISATLHRGVNMVEASAGTGKTYAIAMLVLRFVVEHNVSVEELLVVSYTKAATEELRSRIRERIVAAHTLLSDRGSGEEDAALCSYIDSLSDKDKALKHLAEALLDIDRGAVFTIHSFCQRMLQEQALESGQFFDMELTADISKVRDELVSDYWRMSVYGLSPLHCSLYLERFPDPGTLYESVKGVAVEDSIEPHDRTEPAQDLEVVDQCLTELCGWWDTHSSALGERFQEELEKGMFKKPFPEEFSDWWQQCSCFFSGGYQAIPPNLSWLGSDGLSKVLNGRKLRGDAKKNDFLSLLPLAGTVLDNFLVAREQAILSLRAHLALELQTGIQQRLFEQGRLSFDDLVLSLAKSLRDPSRNDLRDLLSKRFKVALIDEFQDTDAAQYEIFSTLFAGEDREHYLYLIGDPKQAIYKFRGADIHAYFRARKSADYHLGLEKNYRSNPQLVDAVNTLFSQREDAFVSRELPYFPVSSAKSLEDMQFFKNGQPKEAMVYCCLESPDEGGEKAWTSGKCRSRIISCVVAEILDLLQEGSLMAENGGKRQVEASDIAILVRSHKQAEAFQTALALASIPSVLSSRKTVFETEECKDLLQVLRAVVAPSDMRRLRTAMSCKWFGMDGQEFYRRTNDPLLMDAWMERFHSYRCLWEEKGFLAMLNHLFAVESVFETLSRYPLAERAITNLVHLSEIVQDVETEENFSCIRVLQYLSSQREAAQEGEHAQIRLESDEDAVKVVTMHAVKGLEYPIVFCPYLWQRSGWLAAEKYCIAYHDDNYNRVADIGSAVFEERRERALQEELAEEVRLLYVAVTRASARCYVFWADVSKRGKTASSRESALAWLLDLNESEGSARQKEAFANLCNNPSATLRMISAEDGEEKGQNSQDSEERKLSCKIPLRTTFPAGWLMTSYSALAGSGSAIHAAFREPVDGEHKEQNSMGKIHDLPLGAPFGNVVHALLEDHSFAMLASDEEYEEECLVQGKRFGVQVEGEQLMNLLRDVTRTPLVVPGGQELFALKDLAKNDLVKEMPFYFHLREGSTAMINSLLESCDVVRPIQGKDLKGYLTGFIDLVCRHEGKYYIMDYKTNYLGDYLDDYRKEFVTGAMLDHNYGLQYWLYALVLHRFLQANVREYSYEVNFGGVFYLFARGMSAQYPGNGIYFDRPEIGILTELDKKIGAA